MIPANIAISIISGLYEPVIMKFIKNARIPRIPDVKNARDKVAIKLPLIILVEYSVGFKTPKNRPELNLEAKVPLIFPRISKNPGINISIPGSSKKLSPCEAMAVPAIIPPINETAWEKNISSKFLSKILFKSMCLACLQ